MSSHWPVATTARSLPPASRRSRTPAMLAALAVALALGAPPAHASGATPSELGLELIPWSKKLAERRYESPRDWDGTLKFFRDKFKGWKTIKWTREVSLPAVKYVHITNTADAGKWEGINIYALPDGRIRYYLLARAPKAAPPAKTTGPSPAGGSKAEAPAPTG
ncbi:MAG: hypothetical protein IT382_08540 [Deltaproteobacteria bacterium]|nr:hypothetical protein [Deltaproteobacteria bacterium]